MRRLMYRPLWIEIDLEALRFNFMQIKKRLNKKGIKIMAVLKQDGYGHGLLPLAERLVDLGVDFIGLGDLGEAISLREKGINTPLLILSCIESSYIEEVLNYEVIPTVVEINFAKKLNREACKKGVVFPVHIKIDTGMGRLGYWYKDSLVFIREIAKLKNIYLQGLFTHLPAADSDREFTQRQIVIFNNLTHQLQDEGIAFKYYHCANSIALWGYKEAQFNLVRPGLILYGIKPYSEIDIPLRPLLSLKAKVIFVKEVGANRSISYNRTYITPKPTRIATISIGYADGYPWSLSNQGQVLIKGRRYNVVGRVCMDHIMVDVGLNSSVEVGNEVTLIGRSGKETISVEEVASWAKTIPYEIVSRLSYRIRRRYKHHLISKSPTTPVVAKNTEASQLLTKGSNTPAFPKAMLTENNK